MGFKLPRNSMTILTHISLWVVFLGTPILFEPGAQTSMDDVISKLPPPEVRQAIGVALNLALITIFYLNFSVFLPRFYLKGKVWQYFFAVFSTYGIFQMLGYFLRTYIFTRVFKIPAEESITHVSILLSSIFFVLMWAASSGFRLGEEWRRAENQRRETERRRLEAELTLLKSQINPHFLLNSLNNLYALALTQPDKTPEAILKLSEMVAYILHECDQPEVPLARDLKFIQNYLALQRMRLPPNVNLLVEMPERIPDLHIEPMILITFVENAFKHGLTTKEPCTIQVSVRIRGNQLSLEVINPVIAGKSRQKDEVPGIGIANTTQRLHHNYPEKHALTLHNDGRTHQVSLELNLS